jgi:hypothetical protein
LTPVRPANLMPRMKIRVCAVLSDISAQELLGESN